MNFYTGVQMLNVIFILIKPYLANIFYWAVPVKHRVT